MGKLAQLGLPPRFLDFLNAYLLPREGFVRVEGALSDAMALANMVFQGTVLGPPYGMLFSPMLHTRFSFLIRKSIYLLMT